MNWHPSDEDLILHFYRESDANAAARIDAHLPACATCRNAWAELGETLKLVDQATVGEPGPAFERVVWARVQQALPPVRRERPWAVRVLLPMAATIVVCVGAGFYGWRLMHRPSPATAAGRSASGTTPATGLVPASTKTRSTLSERVLLSALDDHMQQAQMLLVELNNAPDEASDFAFERATADDLITSGRLYRLTARQNGDRQYIQMLDELEAVFVEVARNSAQDRTMDLRDVRAHIASQDLLFKVRATTRQIHERQKDLLNTSANE